MASHIRYHLTKRIQFPDSEDRDGPRNVGLLAIHPQGCRPENVSLIHTNFGNATFVVFVNVADKNWLKETKS